MEIFLKDNRTCVDSGKNFFAKRKTFKVTPHDGVSIRPAEQLTIGDLLRNTTPRTLETNTQTCLLSAMYIGKLIPTMRQARREDKQR